MTANFMGNQDQFAFAVAPSFIASVFRPVIDSIVSQPPQTITIPIDLLFTTAHVVYSIALNRADFDLLDGKIVLTVKGHANEQATSGMPPIIFNFTAKFEFTLQADGSTADLVPGDVSLDTSSSIVNLFKASATSGITQTRDQALQQSGAFGAVRNTLDANRNMGGFFSSLLKPASLRFFSPGEEVVLAYTSAEIRSDWNRAAWSLSVVNVQQVFTRGAVGTSAGPRRPQAGWPAPYVEFEQIPASTRGPIAAGLLPEWAAVLRLKSWIPGGTIDRYEWNVHGEFVADNNRFVYIPPPPVLSDGSPGTSPCPRSHCLPHGAGNSLSPSGQVVGRRSVLRSVLTYSFL